MVRDLRTPNGFASREDFEQPGYHLSLITVFTGFLPIMTGSLILEHYARDFGTSVISSCPNEKTTTHFVRALVTHGRLWSDCADAQADLSLRKAYTHFVWFVMWRLKFIFLSRILTFLGIWLIQTSRYECVLENHFLYFSSKHILWVLKRTVSMRRFFWAPTTHFKSMGKKVVKILRK